MVRIVSTYLIHDDPTIDGYANEISPASSKLLSQIDKEIKMARKEEQQRTKQAKLILKSIPPTANLAHPSSLPGNEWAWKRSQTRKQGTIYSYYISHGQLFWVKLS